MFGFRFVKFEPSSHVFVIRNGKTIRSGVGLSFRYFVRSTSFISIPIESQSVPFVFEEQTADFQTVTVQGEVVFRIAQPEVMRQQINFGINGQTKQYLSEDPHRLGQRIINLTKTVLRREIERLSLRQVLKATDQLKANCIAGITNEPYLLTLGLALTNVSILSVLPSKETARALEAETRELILKEADDAIYARRNASVEQERTIKENELNTEIAVENKKRQIRETQLDAERSEKEKLRQMEAQEMAFRIKQEVENSKLVEQTAANARIEADAKAYALAQIVDVYSRMAPDVLRSLAQAGMNPEQLIAGAFDGMARNAEKIGELNLSSELLSGLLNRRT